MTSSRLALALVATLALASGRAYAAGIDHDDTAYPEPASTWSGTVTVEASPQLTYDDTSYPAAHTTIHKELLSASRAVALASADDTTYPTADVQRTPARAPQASDAQERVACGCAHGCAHHG
ncbi:hypothetical protein [Anaeromyxobacter sp. Fw109-5]|uniref:hypothetical protein n=1 Tax=Anaeromyxobacter sp. (strain Fw109-5) TaxID=404589 RepID=UPI0000ED6DB0|nr:hypothetical protein [Anaeromyxobacter sp. Fw109-5]ABS28438.1 hypothetical protein Anae109_4260 [Anaeromyxobacter sp. Fw109-5]